MLVANTTQMATLQGTLLHWDVEDLEIATTHSFRVAAYNKAGGGAISEAAVVDMHSLPAVPSQPLISAVKARSAIATWSAPSDGGSPLLR